LVKQLLLTALALVLMSSVAFAQNGGLTLASTTSTENSGLLDFILPRFTAQTGIPVRVVAVGTGAALNLGRQGDAEVLLVHARQDEDAFIAAGYGSYRRDVMFNDFVIVGPRDDPARIGGGSNAPAALVTIAKSKSTFVSRGDDSGTHRAERRLWSRTPIDPAEASGRWYKETGSGMGATLNTAVGLGAYTMTDRGTWLSFRNRGDLDVLVQGDPMMFNPYGIILVNPARHSHIQTNKAQALIDWMTGPNGQAAIGDFRVNDKQLFFPNVAPR
jgi:tungstate transport system substrate-binding protein